MVQSRTLVGGGLKPLVEGLEPHPSPLWLRACIMGGADKAASNKGAK